MSQIEVLLREALVDAPYPPTTIPDPLADLDRRIARSRMRLAGIAVVSVIALVAAIVVPISLLGGIGDRSARARSVGVERWGDAVAVTSGGGFVWTASFLADGSTHPYRVQGRNPTTGKVTQSYVVAGPIDGMLYGPHRIWTWGGALASGGARPAPEVIGALDLYTGKEATGRLGGGEAITAMTVAWGSAWAVVPSRNELIRVGMRGQVSRRYYKVPEAGHPSRIVHVGLQLEMANARRDVGRFMGQSTGFEFPPVAYQPRWPALAAAGGSSLWAADGNDLVREDAGRGPRPIGPSNERQPGPGFVRRTHAGLRISLPAAPRAVVVDATGGIDVAVANPDGATNAPELLYFSASALREQHPKPTAVHRGGAQFTTMAADPDGGIVFTQNGTALYRWDPTTP